MTPKRGQKRYRLVEYFENGSVWRDDFPAPSDQEAIRRVRSIFSGAQVEVWRGRTLIEHLPRQAPAAHTGNVTYLQAHQPRREREPSPAVELPPAKVARR